MDILIFLTLVTFQLSILAIVAIVYGQSKLADKAISGLHGIIKAVTTYSKRNTTQPKKKAKSLRPASDQSRPFAATRSRSPRSGPS